MDGIAAGRFVGLESQQAVFLGLKKDLIEGPEQITWSHVKSAEKIGLTAGASAPEEMVAAVIAALQSQFSLDIMEAGGGPENVHFKLPRQLRGD